MKNADVYAFGEILWDFLPSGRHVGGAPFNVCAHLAQLGLRPALVSAVGRDDLGDEILKVAADKRVDTRFVVRAGADLPTGTVRAELDQNQNATYEILQPAAWDFIEVGPEARQAIGNGRALVYGSLAGRSPKNLTELETLLTTRGPIKLFDVNLRAPFDDPEIVLRLARRADVLKLNDEEMGLLSTFIQTGRAKPNIPRTGEAIARSSRTLASHTGVTKICVTRGRQGATYWSAGDFTVVPAPEVEVRDTVGAGDAFMACLIHGLLDDVAPARMLEHACHAGAFVASRFGATPGLPASLLEAVRAS